MNNTVSESDGSDNDDSENFTLNTWPSSETSCTNGTDDDNDGDTDCDDSDCSSHSACLPDLDVTYLNCSSSGARGDNVSCNFKGKNNGGTASGSVSVGLYLSTDTTITSQDLLVGTCSLGSLNPGSTSSTTTCSGNIPKFPCFYT